MSAAPLDILIEQGSDYLLTCSFYDVEDNPIDLTDYTFRGQIRNTYSDNDIIATFVIAISGDPLDGVITISLDSATTTAIGVVAATSYKKHSTKFSYDIESVAGDGFVTRILEGVAEVSPETTR